MLRVAVGDVSGALRGSLHVPNRIGGATQLLNRTSRASPSMPRHVTGPHVLPGLGVLRLTRARFVRSQSSALP